MKPIDFEKILFPVNAIVTAVVFLMIAPATHIYARWFPDKKASLWWIPAGILGVSALVWFFASLSLPRLIQRGIFEDRRKKARAADENLVNVPRVAGAVLNFVIHMAFLLLMSACFILEMNKGITGKFFFSRNIQWRAP